MAHVDITGTQHYTQGIGQTKAAVNPQPPVEFSIDPLTGMGVGIAGKDGRTLAVSGTQSHVLTLLKDAQLNPTALVTASTTFHIETVLESDFDAVRIGVFNNINSTTSCGVSVAPASISGADNTNATIDPTLNGGAWSACTFAGAASVALPACTDVANPNVTWTDWAPCSSLARTDGGVLPVLHVRMLMNSAAVPTTINDSGFTAWESEAASSSRFYRARQQAGNAWSTPSLFTSTTSTGIFPVIAIQYISRKVGRTILVCGDSITRGTGATLKNNGWAQRLMGLLSTPSAPVSVVNLGWGSQTSNQYSARLQYALSNGISPTLVCYAGWCPNGAVPLTQTDYGRVALALGIASAACIQAQIPMVVWGVLPTDSTSKNWGASDSYRTAWRTVLAQQKTYLDVSSLVPVTVVSGQEIPSAGYFADGLHPSDALHQSMAVAFQTYVGGGIPSY